MNQTKRSAKQLRATAYRALTELHASDPQTLRDCAEDLENLARVNAMFGSRGGVAAGDAFRRGARLLIAIAELAELGPAAAEPGPSRN